MCACCRTHCGCWCRNLPPASSGSDTGGVYMRSIWSGAISFGLIYIPVRLYSASETQELDFDLLRREDLCPIRYAKVCRETGEEVPYEDIVKGYQYKKGD